jgi:hypothetical protein
LVAMLSTPHPSIHPFSTGNGSKYHPFQCHFNDISMTQPPTDEWINRSITSPFQIEGRQRKGTQTNS